MALSLSGCEGETQMWEDDGRLRVVTTIFPYYDFARQVAGDRIDLRLAVPAGMDSHSFEPTPADMRLIQEADLIICNGGEMEHWLSQVLDAIDAPQLKEITMMDYVETFEEILVEGMEESAHSHEHVDSLGDDGHEEEIEYDEHIWTSPKNAMVIVEKIADTFKELDPEGAGIYEANAAAYEEELEELDQEFEQVVADEKRNMIIIGGKFPFRYLAEAYGLEYRAAFSGCSTDTEPSAKTIAYLIDQVREHEIPVVYYLELSSTRVAEIISEETGAETLLLHSCHNVTRREFDSGVTYLELMRKNAENLRKGLDE
ncbi:MAG TPA: metal ABC transporter substrate-binding protein [Candidatus Lachnoclostridium pullistercoris]|uniref:Metal ABC transporter substrate-binding protein n=1 Tax=Candidatus Lachnoclostridium pullistercoris TaxID=2838632 RepID=A0A9D2PCV8_9FIRM|nr:metal ABC transporter substrate-binding protein [Candidatus Lachnoclostridium pullistercoris]